MQTAYYARGLSALSHLAVKGVGVVLLVLIFRRWRKLRHNGTANECVGRGQEMKSAPRTTHSSLSLPVRVDAAMLPSCLSVGLPLFYPPRMVVIPLSRADTLGSGGSCFIVCEGPLLFHRKASEGRDNALGTLPLLVRYLQDAPFLQTLAKRNVPLRQLRDVGLSGVSSVFSHIVLDQAERTAVLLGCNGPYVVSLLLIPFVMPLETVGGDTVRTCQFSVDELEMLLHACTPSPLMDGIRVVGTPKGTLQGKQHVTFRHSNRLVCFTVAPILTVRSAPVGANFICSVEGDILPCERVLLDSSTVDMLFGGSSFDELYPCDGLQHSCISPPIQLTRVEDLIPSQNLASHVCDGSVTVGEKHDSTGFGLLLKEGDIRVVFHHPYLGVHFPVDPHRAVVYEPVLTGDLCLLYYPAGRGGLAPPCATIRRLAGQPSTWECVSTTDDILKHNALFHFTDWTSGSVPCATCELSGFRCAQLYEEKDRMSCRTYVVPLSNAIMVLRWETQTNVWGRYLPLLQTFLDTVHLEDSAR